MKERAYAKINLCLDVVRRREDGYHDLKMIMVLVDFYDLLDIVPAAETTLKLNRSYLPVNEKNTVIKAIQVMRERFGFREEFACTLAKHIPTQAGLAGGSADAAAAIRILNRMLKLNLTIGEMAEIGRQVGSDVPFCVINKPALVEGTGEIITPFTCPADFLILLVKPRRGISTKVAFENLDIAAADHPDCEKMRAALISGDYGGVIAALGNTLEEISLKLVPEIRQIKEELTEMGFDGVLMSGSGSTVFAITRNGKLVERARNIMWNRRYFVRVTRILNGKEEK